MADSDDYGFDDIVLDDQALALLDQEEQKYLHRSTVQTAVTPVVQEEQANKRHKTPTGWTPGIGADLGSTDSYDDLPEISLRGDGSYGIGGRLAPQPHRNQSTHYRNPPNDSVQSIVTHSRNIPNAQASGSRHYTSRQVIPANVRQQQSFHNGNPRVQEHPAHIQNDDDKRYLQTQMMELQKKLDEMREENFKMQSSLKAAIDTKLAKEGEVSILRRNIEKTSQNHAAQLLHLKTEKEKAEMKQTQMQKDMKDELERLRSQMLFKQHELESSSMRKLPGSIRAKKGGRDFPSTPLAVPASMSAWNRGASQAQGSRRMSDETPVRAPRTPFAPISSPSKQPRKSPEKLRNLPGFQNAFETLAPVRSPSKRVDKGKKKAESDFSVFGGEVDPILYASSQPSMGPAQPVPQITDSQALKQEIDRIPAFVGSSASEVSQMNSEALTESDEDVEMQEMEAFEAINWKAELCRIILTHCHSSTGQITFQQLLGCSEYTKSPQDYTTSCSRILEVISNSARVEDLKSSVEIVCSSLLFIFEALRQSQQLHSLAILTNLLARLVLSLPMFQSVLFTSQSSLVGDGTSVVDIICRVILENLEPTKVHIQRDEIAVESISLLQLLCFQVPQESVKKLEAFAQNHNVLLLMLHATQPTWLLEKAAMLLVLLSTHHSLFRAILGMTTATNEERGEEEPIKNPFIERLCSLLIDSNKAPAENFKIYILTFLAQISIAHPDAHAVLVGSNVLIPSLVLYISHLTTPLWEEDEPLASSVETTTSFVRALNQTIFLLYYLIFGLDPCLNLRYKLQHAPHRPFNGISHAFVVSFGRLSYCDPPSWVGIETRQELEFLSEIARDILEVVVDGPEGDSVWAAFQTEPDETSVIDEEEMEARLIGGDM